MPTNGRWTAITWVGGRKLLSSPMLGSCWEPPLSLRILLSPLCKSSIYDPKFQEESVFYIEQYEEKKLEKELEAVAAAQASASPVEAKQKARKKKAKLAEPAATTQIIRDCEARAVAQTLSSKPLSPLESPVTPEIAPTLVPPLHLLRVPLFFLQHLVRPFQQRSSLRFIRTTPKLLLRDPRMSLQPRLVSAQHRFSHSV